MCRPPARHWSNIPVKMIAPERKERFTSVDGFLTAMAEVKRLRSVLTTGEIGPGPRWYLGWASSRPSPIATLCHPSADPLQPEPEYPTQGTRGLDEVGRGHYVPTYLDEKLKPALLKGEFKLVDR